MKELCNKLSFPAYKWFYLGTPNYTDHQIGLVGMIKIILKLQNPKEEKEKRKEKYMKSNKEDFIWITSAGPSLKKTSCISQDRIS